MFKKATWIVLSATILASLPSHGQVRYPAQKASEPLQVSSNILVLADEVMRQQWPASLALVNAPSDLTQVEPGQCIHFGVIASGDGRDEALSSAKFTFEFTLAGEVQTFALESAVVKQVKPTGGDFVTQALGAAGITNPLSSLASLAASKASWCAVADIQDGTATVRGVVNLVSGTTVTLNERTLTVMTLESARRQPAFTDMEGLSQWIQRYYAAPQPAQLLPGLRLIAADEKARSTHSLMAFFVAAFKASPVAAEEAIDKLPDEHPWTRIYAIPLLRHAGYPTERSMEGLPEDVKASLRSIEIPSAFDLNPDRLLPSKMDMLWATFFATGRIEPVRVIASMLEWRGDYEKLNEMRQSGTRPTELTDSLMRAAAYVGAGWSLNSLSRNYGLVADYVEAIKSSPDTSATVKAELANLHTNPAFRMQK